MQRKRLIGLAVLGVALVCGAPGVATASAKRALQLEVPHEALTSGTRVDTELNFTMATSRGPVACKTYAEGPITSGGLKDVFTAEYNYDRCEGEGTLTEGGLGVSGLTFSVGGRATVDLTAGVDWPEPDEACMYAKSKLKGTNTVSGALGATFSGKLSGSNCGEREVRVTTTYFYMNLASPEWGQLEASVSGR